jgi:hypothetical protein
MRLECQSAADVVIVVVSEIVVFGLRCLEDRLVGTSWGVFGDVKGNRRQTPRIWLQKGVI